MCIIIVNYNNHLPFDCFVGNNEDNPDGVGIFYANNNKLNVKKFAPDTDIEEIYKYYSDVRKDINSTIVIHFRKMSRGKRDLAGVHPFYINDNLVMAHNGTFLELGDKNESDTVQFTNILKSLPPNFLDDPNLVKLIKLAADANRLVFMDNYGKVTIIDETQMGRLYKGDWYSKNVFYRY